MDIPPSPFPLPDIDHPDFLAIDDLLDFSNDDICAPIADSVSAASSISNPVSAVSISTTTSAITITSSSTTTSPLPSLLDKKPPPPALSVFDSTDLCVPCDDIAELEWLSNFVEESFSSGDNLSLGCNGGFCKDPKPIRGGTSNEQFKSTSPVSVLESNTHSREKTASSALSFSPDMSVPARARSKRSRSTVCFWNSRILSAEASESILESSSTTSTITAASSDSDMFTAYYDDDYDDNDEEDIEDDDDDDQQFQYQHQLKREYNPLSGKARKFSKLHDNAPSNKPKKVKVNNNNTDAGGPVRKCLHCATTKTPQWRAGPMGPKTLCNACGVRYKSGRLCPEYRPASSPTFNETVHSNSHRRVLEMRKQRGDPINDSHSHIHGQYSKLCYSSGGEGQGRAASIRE